MRSNSPFRQQNSCDLAKQKMKAAYKKDGKLEEYKRDVKEFGCVEGKWKIIQKQDNDFDPVSITKKKPSMADAKQQNK